MKNKDKFGNIILPYIYSQLLSIGKKLESIGYTESDKKPNLFYNSVDSGMFFADMRGTKEVMIWKEPVPLVWAKFKEDTPLWKKNRIQNEMEKGLKDANIPFRHSFYEEIDDVIDLYYYLEEKHRQVFKSDALFEGFIYDSDKYSSGPNPSKVDGYCIICGVDIQRDTLFCDRCFKIEYYKMEANKVYEAYKNMVSKLKTCFLCSRYIYIYKPKAKNSITGDQVKKLLSQYNAVPGLVDHIEYRNTEKTIAVCRGCHNKLLHTDSYPDLNLIPGKSLKPSGKMVKTGQGDNSKNSE